MQLVSSILRILMLIIDVDHELIGRLQVAPS